MRFNAAGPAGLIDRKAPGKPPKLNKTQREALAAIVKSGPIPAIHGVVRWRLVDLRVVSRMLRTFHFQAVAGLASVSICFNRSMFI